MSFEPAKASLAADVAANSAAFADVPGLALKFVVLQDQSLVEFAFQGLLALDVADRADLRFVLQNDGDAAPAFAPLPDAGAQGDQSFHAVAGTAGLLMPVSFGEKVVLQPGRYTAKLQHKEAAAGVLTVSGDVANGQPSSIRVTPISNDALVATGEDHEHVGGSY